MKKRTLAFAGIFSALVLAFYFAPQKQESVPAEGIATKITSPPSSRVSRRTEKGSTASNMPSDTENARDSGTDQSLRKIQALSRVVMQSPEKIEALRPLLNDLRVQMDIRRSLSDANTYEGAAFTRKLRLLDAMYEGFKFPETAVSEQYFDLAVQIMTGPVPESWTQNPELSRQFVADRAEIAMALLKAFPQQARSIEARIGDHNPQALAAFKRAHALMDVYEVAL